MNSLLIKLPELFELSIQKEELVKIRMQKFKNCISFSLPSNSEIKIIWHYSGKFYIGQFVNNEKHGEGIEVSENHYYHGSFANGKRNG
jgi:hypothetical protein